MWLEIIYRVTVIWQECNGKELVKLKNYICESMCIAFIPISNLGGLWILKHISITAILTAMLKIFAIWKKNILFLKMEKSWFAKKWKKKKVNSSLSTGFFKTWNKTKKANSRMSKWWIENGFIAL